MSILSQFFPGISGTYATTIPLNILVQAGGGGGGGHFTPNPAYTGGGGGAGGLGMTHNYRVVPGTTCPIVVGSGGAAGTPSGSNPGVTAASNGGFSAFNVPFDGKASSIQLEGGGAGGGVSNDPAVRFSSDGGCGGGESCGAGPGIQPLGFNQLASVSTFPSTGGRGYYSSSTTPQVGEEVTNQTNTITEWGVAYGHPGGHTCQMVDTTPNPLGVQYIGKTDYIVQDKHLGATGGSVEYNSDISELFSTAMAVVNYTNFNYGGKISYITGTLTTYGRGGGTKPQNNPAGGFAAAYNGFPAPTTANSGNGGDGGNSGPLGDFAAVAGQSGVVVVQYPSAYPAAPSFPGATDVSPATPGYRTYRFTSSGSITLP